MSDVVLLQPEGCYLEDVATWYGTYTASPTGNIPVAQRRWIFATGSHELRLVNKGYEGAGMVGGGQGFMEMSPIPPFAIMTSAYLSDRGIEPITRDHYGDCDLKSGSNLDVQMRQGQMKWRLSGYKRVGSNAWIDPYPSP
jgi:hypothetical protein